MNALDQIELDRPLATGKYAGPSNFGPKTILLHLQNDESVDSRLESALSLARAFSAHIECLHITPIEAYVAFDNFGGVFVMNDIITALDEQEQALRSKVEAKLGHEDVSWNYTQVTGNVPNQLISHAAVADLLIVGREPHRSDFQLPAVGLLGDLVHRSRTPLYIPSDEGPSCDPTGPALIAWDGSYEAANAVRSSIGMLKLASAVHVVRVEEEKAEGFPSTVLLEYLSRHDVHAIMTVESVDDIHLDKQLVPAILVTRAEALGASYLVMGGYNHSRIGEYLFGGMTRTMLSSSPIPIVIGR